MADLVDYGIRQGLQVLRNLDNACVCSRIIEAANTRSAREPQALALHGDMQRRHRAKVRSASAFAAHVPFDHAFLLLIEVAVPVRRHARELRLVELVDDSVVQLPVRFLDLFIHFPQVFLRLAHEKVYQFLRHR